MARFTYTAIAAGAGHAAAGGAGRMISGRMDSASEAALREALKSKGLIALDVRPVNALAPTLERLRGERLGGADVAWFYRTLHRLLESKMPIETAVATMEDIAPKPKIKEAASAVRSALRGGASLADAVAEIPGLASEEVRALLRVGMASGKLEHTVQLIDRSLQTRQRLRRSIAGRLAYPAILFLASLLAVWFLSSFVIPRFAETLQSVGAELPASTRYTLAVSRYAVWAAPLAIVGLVAIVAGKPWRRWPALADALDRRLLTAPVVGRLIWHGQSVIVTDTLATVLEGGGEVLDGLEHASRALKSPVLRGRLDAARQRIREGADLGAAIADAKVLPPMPSAFVRVGMKSGRLVESLRSAVEISVEEQERLTARLLTLMEPGIILFLAGVVGWIVYALVSGMLAVNDLGAI